MAGPRDDSADGVGVPATFAVDAAAPTPPAAPLGGGYSEGVTPEPRVDGKWSPRATILFVLVTCSLFWIAVAAAWALFFR